MTAPTPGPVQKLLSGLAFGYHGVSMQNIARAHDEADARKDEALRQAKTDLRAIERVAMTRRNEGDRYGGNEASGRVWRGTLQFIATSAAVAIAVIDEVLP